MKYKAVLKGMLIALGIAFAVITVISGVNCFLPIDGGISRIIILAGLATGVTFSSFGVCSGCEKMKLFNGLGIGMGCLLAVSLLSIIMCGGISFNLHFLTACTCCIAASVLGAVLAA